MKRHWIYRDGEGLVEVCRQAPRPRVHIRGDTIEPMRSMADGKHYTSLSRYRAELKARGYEQVGNERAAFEPEPFKSDGIPELRETVEQMGL